MALSSATIKKIQALVGATVDGVWGPNTQAAVKRWQGSHGLAADGIVGSQTLAKMGLNSTGGSVGGTSGSAKTKSTTKGPTSAEMTKFAEDYGYQLAFLKSDKELYGIFQKAMTGKWDATRFVAAVKASGWYKTHGEAYRQNLALKTTDPATYNQRLSNQRGIVADLGSQMGVQFNSDTISKIAEQAIMFGFNDNQLRQTISGYIAKGSKLGEAGQIQQKLRETAFRNGINISDDYILRATRKITAGEGDIASAQQLLRDTYAKRYAPGFEKEIGAGMDLYDLASPYMQSMATTLELNPSDLNMFDPTIRKAMLSSSTKDGKPGSMPLWEFEQNLRQDKRFLKTKQAQDQTMSVGNKVLQDFGLIK